MNTPNRENIRKWVDALRSGAYKQGKGSLSADGTFCCLGVACEVAIKEGVEVEKHKMPQKVIDVYVYDGSSGRLPIIVSSWLGIMTSNPCVADSDVITLNDDLNWSFEQIATVLEKEYLT